VGAGWYHRKSSRYTAVAMADKTARKIKAILIKNNIADATLPVLRKTDRMIIEAMAQSQPGSQDTSSNVRSTNYPRAGWGHGLRKPSGPADARAAQTILATGLF
jgi:hypothetical protein